MGDVDAKAKQIQIKTGEKPEKKMIQELIGQELIWPWDLKTLEGIPGEEH